MFFRIPPFLRPRRSFNRLRSFHLISAEAAARVRLAQPQFPMGGTRSQTLACSQVSFVEKDASSEQPQPSNIDIPLHGSTIAVLALIASILFIFSISLAFVGADVEEPNFMHMLNHISHTEPGVRRL